MDPEQLGVGCARPLRVAGRERLELDDPPAVDGGDDLESTWRPLMREAD
ncbi:MAG: hypothetical protein ACXVRJ_02005 [Gaiellaceae bacterium]